MSVSVPLVLLNNMHPPCTTSMDLLKKVIFDTACQHMLGGPSVVSRQLHTCIYYTAVTYLSSHRSISPIFGSQPANAEMS